MGDYWDAMARLKGIGEKSHRKTREYWVKHLRLKQCHTCGLETDWGAKFYAGCHALECTPFHPYTGAIRYCDLGFKRDDKNNRPLEPCYKPMSEPQHVAAMRLREILKDGRKV